MEITDDMIDHLSGLSKLEFTEEEREKIRNDLSRILDFVGKLKELDTENVAPLIYISDRVNILRPDEIKQEMTHEEALKNAPDTDGRFFLVPKVIKK